MTVSISRKEPTIQRESLATLAREAALAVGLDEGYEVDQLVHCGEALRHSSAFVDVGANAGVYGYMANRVLRGARITLVEANPDLVEALRRAVSRWPQDRHNDIEIAPVAAGDVSTVLPMFLSTKDVHGTLTLKNGASAGTIVDVTSEPLDKLVGAQAHTLIKVDVEGFEFRVLKGARRLLSEEGVRVLIELHGWGDAEQGKYPYHVVTLMRSWGFAGKRVSASYTYDFVKAGVGVRFVAWCRYGLPLAAKYVLRSSGLRPSINRVPGRPG